MDLSDPTRAITPTLDGPVLAVLAAAGHPLTVGQIAAQAARGSEIGVRRSVSRLVEQGIVTAVQMGANRVHELNRDHLAASAAEALAGLRLELWRRLRTALDGWEPKPRYACAYGSVARGDGGPDSDVDVLLVHPPMWGDVVPPTADQAGLGPALRRMEAVLHDATALPPEEADRWQHQVDELHTKVLRWTGNLLHVVDIPLATWQQRSRIDPAFFSDVDRDGIVLSGVPALTALPGRR